MTQLFGEQPDGATPLDDVERAGLIPAWVATHGDLNRAEQENIAAAQLALRRRRRRLTVPGVLDEAFVRQLHALMFGDVWSWAGKYRLTEKNIGIAWWDIAPYVTSLMADTALWVAADSLMPVDEAAVRLHHRLAAIHPFSNGNGRHAREMSNLLLRAVGEVPLTWGRNSLTDAGETRHSYVAALRAADGSDIGPLLTFART